ncbi:MAG: hypothetical protein WKF42_09355 [Solirubrobacteraceae bacterium]
MNDRRLLAAALGFAFVAAWIGFNFGYALLCLLGAAVFWAAAAVLDGNIDLGELQARFTNSDDGPAPAPRPRTRPRVQ